MPHNRLSVTTKSAAAQLLLFNVMSGSFQLRQASYSTGCANVQALSAVRCWSPASKLNRALSRLLVTGLIGCRVRHASVNSNRNVSRCLLRMCTITCVYRSSAVLTGACGIMRCGRNSC